MATKLFMFYNLVFPDLVTLKNAEDFLKYLQTFHYLFMSRQPNSFGDYH